MDMAIETYAIGKCFDTRTSYDSSTALKGISFALPAGASLCLLGANGAGKTTLLRILSALCKPSEGSARIFGFDVQESANEVRKRIGFVGHSPMVYPHLTAQENLEFYAQLYGLKNASERVQELLEIMELTVRKHDLVSTFSRGMLQRLSIARALVHSPELLLLDEPYAGLDTHAKNLLDEILANTALARTFVMVSHNTEKALALCSHALVLAGGRMSFFGPADEVFSVCIHEVLRGGDVL